LDGLVGVASVVVSGRHHPDTIVILLGIPGSVDLLKGLDIVLSIDNILVDAEVGDVVVFRMLLWLLERGFHLVLELSFSFRNVLLGTEHLRINTKVGNLVVNIPGGLLPGA